VYVVMNSEQVRSLREEKGFSKRGLAAAAGVTQKTARKTERSQPVSRKTARKIAAALGVDDPRGMGRVVRTPKS
jgi:transcriptional regulator with XRE-family HTH domain